MPRKDPEARRAYQRERKALYPEKVLAQSAASRAKHRETIRAKDAARREANRERIRVEDRARYAANPEPKKAAARARHVEKRDEIREQKRVKHAANPGPDNERSIQWQKDNRERRNARERTRHAEHPEMHRTRNARRRARICNLPDTFTIEQEAFMLAYWHYACAVCGREEGFFWQLVADHWVAVTTPDCPGTIATNMIPLCNGQGGCNTSKRHSQPQQWLEKRFGKAKAAGILTAIDAYFTVVQTRFPSTPSAAAD